MVRTSRALIGTLALAIVTLVAASPIARSHAGIAITIRPSAGVNFRPSTGGFCDVRGCPLGYWNLPVYYGPVLYRGVWYKGPVYYRQRLGAYEFWVSGSWHRNEWVGPPPAWAGKVEMGPPLGHEYYRQQNWSDWRYWRKHGWHGRHGPY